VMFCLMCVLCCGVMVIVEGGWFVVIGFDFDYLIG